MDTLMQSEKPQVPDASLDPAKKIESTSTIIPSGSPGRPSKNRRGFAGMDPEKLRKYASMGGKAVPAEKRSFSQSQELARAAGRKGGSNIPPEKRTYSRDRALAVRSGRKGGLMLQRGR